MTIVDPEFGHFASVHYSLALQTYSCHFTRALNSTLGNTLEVDSDKPTLNAFKGLLTLKLKRCTPQITSNTSNSRKHVDSMDGIPGQVTFFGEVFQKVGGVDLREAFKFSLL